LSAGVYSGAPDADEKIRVVYADAFFGEPTERVMRLTYETSEPPTRPWWKLS
jgi:hypothetical protein